MDIQELDKQRGKKGFFRHEIEECGMPLKDKECINLAKAEQLETVKV